MALHDLRLTLGLDIGKKLARKTRKGQSYLRSKTIHWLNEWFFLILQDLGATHFLECGAHEASASAKFVRSMGGEAVAIEANPTTFERKTSLVEKHGVTVINCGVADHSGKMDFHIPSHALTPGNATFRKEADRDYVTHTIDVTTIDDVVADTFKSKYRLGMWVDVEGMALEVLEGGKETLSGDDCLAIKVEVETFELFHGQSLAGEVDRHLSALGYTAVLCDFEGRQQFNVVYVKKSHLDIIDETLQKSLQAFSKLETTAIGLFLTRLRRIPKSKSLRRFLRRYGVRIGDDDILPKKKRP